MLLTKGKWILIGVLIILLGGTLTYFGWTKQKSEPDNSQPEQTEAESVREVVIPSSLNPAEVVAQFVPYIPPWGDDITKLHDFWETKFTSPYPHKGFVKGFFTAWHGEAAYWIKKDGAKVCGADDPYGFILDLAVLKYEKPEYAKKDYDRMSIDQESNDSTLNGVKLKTKIETDLSP